MNNEVTHKEVMAFADQNLGKKINFGHLATLTKAYKGEFIIEMIEKAVKENVEKLPEQKRVQYVNALCKKYATSDDMKTIRKIKYTDMSVTGKKIKKLRANGVIPKRNNIG